MKKLRPREGPVKKLRPREGPEKERRRERTARAVKRVTISN